MCFFRIGRLVRTASLSGAVIDDPQDLGDGVAAFERMSQRALGVDVVPIATPDPLANQEAGVLEFVQDPLHGALGDPHQLADVALGVARGCD